MKLGPLLLALHLGMGAVLLAAGARDEPPNAAGLSHERHASMRAGGPGLDRTAPVLGLGAALGSLATASFAASLALGLRRSSGAVPCGRALLAGALGHQLCWALLVGLAWRFAHDPEGTALVLGLPAPTAFMVYGFGAFPLVFLVLYVRHFERAVWSEADEARFRAALAALRSGTAEPR